MAIDTVKWYKAQHALPLYLKVGGEGHNDYEVGEKYDIRVEDEKRQQGKEGEGRFNYIHESLLVAKRTYDSIEELDNIVKAFVAETNDPDEARDWLSSYDVEGKEVYLLVFLRLDAAKGFVMNELDSIPQEFSKDATEGNG